MLCVLMFIFCLIGLLPEIHTGRILTRDPRNRECAKEGYLLSRTWLESYSQGLCEDEVQRYLMCKSISSLVIAANALISSYKDEIEVFVMLALWWMKVPLTVVWLPGAVSDLGGRSGAWSRSSPTSFQT